MPVTRLRTQWRSGYLAWYNSDGSALGLFGVPLWGIQFYKRLRVLTTDVNTGKELLPAIPNFCYQMVSMAEISYGGAAATCTTVDIKGTQGASSVKLMAGGQAALTQSALVVAGVTSGGTILADGASFMVCDVNTAINVGATTNNLATSTGIDFLVEFVLIAG